MPASLTDTKSGRSSEALITSLSSRISVPEIARRLDIGRLAVYVMLEQGLLPGIRLGRRWIVTRHAFEEWERTCGMRLPGLPSAPGETGLLRQAEHKVNWHLCPYTNVGTRPERPSGSTSFNRQERRETCSRSGSSV